MDDKQIIRLFFERSEQAITELSQKYGDLCMKIARRILNDHQDAEECVNDTYMNTWNSIPPSRPEILSTYLGKIVRNLSFNLYKKNKAEKRGGGQIAIVLDELSEIIADSKTTEEEWNHRQLVDCINDFLGGLSVQKRSLFVCRYWYADSVKEIAKRFGMTENNVSVVLRRLRSQLHNYLIERGFEL